MIEIKGRNVPQAYKESIWVMKTYGDSGVSRNGPVISIPEPVMLTIQYPWERVLFDPVRDANPFFHVMEFVWMMAGSQNALWISQFNKRMLEYSDEGILRGAYGWRWSQHDQIRSAIRLLRKDPDTRQAVLSMWDPALDGSSAKSSDRPCNTHIYFRAGPTGLDMTVCNRSNDMIWGMLGANAVHMTMLHELVALASGFKQGVYRVFTNNLHVYPDMPNFNSIYRKTFACYDPYSYEEVRTTPLLDRNETYEMFMSDCRKMVDGDFEDGFRTNWVENVAYPMYEAYLGEHRIDYIRQIDAPDWERACSEWNARRYSAKQAAVV